MCTYVSIYMIYMYTCIHVYMCMYIIPHPRQAAPKGVTRRPLTPPPNPDPPNPHTCANLTPQPPAPAPCPHAPDPRRPHHEPGTTNPRPNTQTPLLYSHQTGDHGECQNPQTTNPKSKTHKPCTSQNGEHTEAIKRRLDLSSAQPPNPKSQIPNSRT